MLEIVLPAVEYWDEKKEEFVVSKKEQKLQFMHSLVSLSKWESKYCKPFLSTHDKTYEEILDYIKFMTITQNVKDETYERLFNLPGAVQKIQEHINAPMTATTFVDNGGGKSNSEQITAELIYYWMISLQIPVEFQKWHLNRLLTLIRVCNVKNQPPKKMSKRDINARNAALNAARRKQFNTPG